MSEPSNEDRGAGLLRRGSSKRAPRVTGVSADVRRGRTLARTAFATLAGALLAAAIGAIARGGTGRRFEPSVPHQRAGLTCSQCHDTPAGRSRTEPAGVGIPSATCVGCHGDHESTRPGHRARQRSGELRCGRCHTLHAEDEGVIFASSGSFERYRGRATVGGQSRFRPTGAATVPLVPLSSCATCHRLDAADDPIARCLVGGDVGGIDGCFDEHRRALEGDRARPGAAVCAGQHQAARPFAWDAARLVAGAVKAPRPGATAGWLAFLAMASGCFAGGLTLLLAGRLRGPGGLAAGAAVPTQKGKNADEEATLPLVPARRIRLPRIDESRCLGCFACVDACPYDVLAIENYVAKVVREEACCGVVLCQQRCPNGSLVIAEGALRPDVPPVDARLESELVPGIFLAGDVTGGSLIKNAIRQGTAAVDAAKASLAAAEADVAARADRADRADHADTFDLAIIGAGPAGIAAALRAKELGLRFVLIERGSIAESIRSFPRGKLVFDQPLELPSVGKLWLAESTKEELLAQWLRIVRREGLLPHVREREVLDTIEWREVAGRFRLGCREIVAGEPVEGAATASVAARRIVLATGKRGTARRLPVPIPEEATSWVHYHLADARSFEGQRVVVVGLGDVAMEAALALVGQAGATVTLVHRGSGFARGSERNVVAVRRAVQSGTLRLLLDTSVTAVREAEIVVQTGPAGGAVATETLPLDALLVLIGHEAPRTLLERWGVLAPGAET
jgi:thioredoxin reductase